MRKKHFLWLLPLVLVLVLSSACHRPRSSRHVAWAEVTCLQTDTTYTYHRSADLTSLLTWLRLLRPGTPVKAISAPQETIVYRICLHFSDNTQRTYHLQNFRYLSADGQTWRTVRSAYAYQLLSILYYL